MQEQATSFIQDKIPRGASNALKAGLVGVLVLVFAIPLEMTKSVVREREGSRDQAVADIAEKAGGRAVLGALALRVPVGYTEIVETKEGLLVPMRRERAVWVLPDRLSVRGDCDTSLRSRGIYRVPVYAIDALIEASFSLHPAQTGLREAEIAWNRASIVLEFPDSRSLREAPRLIQGGRPAVMRSTADTALLSGGKALAAPIALAAKEGRAERSAAVSVEVSFNGAESLSFLPMGTDTEVTLAGNWPSPSFNGYRLPAERSIGKGGFTAAWLAEESARPLPRVFFAGEDGNRNAMAAGFGLDFLIATDVYLQAHRSLRYGILFIFIPFAALFLFEALLKLKIHPVQYVLIGLADAVFYALVLSLSEHMAFRIAYLIAAAAVTALIGLYALGAFKAARKTLLIVPAIAGQYAYLFFALESEDYALLTGTIGLFILIAITMLATRRFDWYGGQAGPKRKTEAQRSPPGSLPPSGEPISP